MKKILLLIIALAPFVTRAQSSETRYAKGQSAEGKITAKEQYCMVLATEKTFSNKVNITVDYGQATKLFSFKDERMKDETGKVMSFNSVIDALNYMASQGWTFVNAYALSVGGSNVLHYVLKRQL